MFLRTGFLFVGSPFFIDFESELEKKQKVVNHRSPPGNGPEFQCRLFSSPWVRSMPMCFDLCPCVSKRIIIWLSTIRAIRRKPRRGRHFVAQLWKSLSQKKGYCRNGHECLPNAKTVYIITKCEPKSKRIILTLFQLNNMSPTKWGLLRSLFCMTKKHVPYKSTLGFYKIQKFYKNTAHLQKYVLKLGLGKHFSYWNWARRGPQAQPFGSGNFDPHP